MSEINDTTTMMTDITGCPWGSYDVNGSTDIAPSRTSPPPPKNEGWPVEYEVNLNTDILLAQTKKPFQAQAIAPKDVSDINSLLAMLGPGADLAFIVYAMQIQQMDRQVANSIQEIRNAGNLRDALSNRIGELRDMRGQLEKQDGMKDGDTTEIFPNTKESAVLRKIDYALDAKTGTVSPVKAEQLGEKDNAFKDSHQVSLADIDAEIKRVDAQAQKLDSDREIKMILFNQTLNKKNPAVSQLANILKKNHETQSSVINNLR